ncbi:multidrug resistance protein 4 [Mycena maculata]|uniref:Multidrug resistance protein 4 n=1 Tax=Mycena maculata TaxID=230809 RepID=A0AAD7J4C0_9AGAR|nr:multidrug resistance protein 4 [Mycena maculata]
MVSPSSSLTNVPAPDETQPTNTEGSSTQDHPSRGPSAIPEDKKKELLENFEDDWQDDPENPRSWPLGTKWTTTTIVRVIRSQTCRRSTHPWFSIMALSLPEVAAKYDITNMTVTALTLSIFLISFGIGMSCARWNSCRTYHARYEIQAKIRALNVDLLGLAGFVTEIVGVKRVFIIVAGESYVLTLHIYYFDGLGATWEASRALLETYSPLLRLRKVKKSAGHPVLVKGHSGKLHCLWINLSRLAMLLVGSPVCFMLSLYVWDFSCSRPSTLAKQNGGKGEPEMRIPAVIFGSIFVPVELFVPNLGIFGFGMTTTLSCVPAWMRVPAIRPRDVRRPRYNNGDGNSLLVGLAIVLGIPFPVYLYYRGASIRAKSKLTQ